jgi:hypothetical protein
LAEHTVGDFAKASKFLYLETGFQI